MDAKRRECTMCIGDFHVHIGCVAAGSWVPHCTEPKGVRKIEQLVLKRGDLGLGVTITDRPQYGSSYNFV